MLLLMLVGALVARGILPFISRSWVVLLILGLASALPLLIGHRFAIHVLMLLMFMTCSVFFSPIVSMFVFGHCLTSPVTEVCRSFAAIVAMISLVLSSVSISRRLSTSRPSMSAALLVASSRLFLLLWWRMVDVLIIVVSTKLIIAPLVEKVAIRVEEAAIWIDIEALVFISAIVLISPPLHIYSVLFSLYWPVVLRPSSITSCATLRSLVKLFRAVWLLAMTLTVTLICSCDDLPNGSGASGLITILP